ncbi:MAG: DUF3106 domain-containing protein [Thiogranum sp.]|nr:DUF3106 domain-containing protein [Thiogranum sp.]
MRSCFIALALVSSLLVTLPDTAQADRARHDNRLYLADRGEVPWQSLSPQEQDALREYRGNWEQYGGDRQERIRKGAQRYLELPPDERRKVEQKRREYQQLSPQERERLREEYHRRGK